MRLAVSFSGTSFHASSMVLSLDSYPGICNVISVSSHMAWTAVPMAAKPVRSSSSSEAGVRYLAAHVPGHNSKVLSDVTRRYSSSRGCMRLVLGVGCDCTTIGVSGDVDAMRLIDGTNLFSLFLCIVHCLYDIVYTYGHQY